jgi:hypothetical protein
MRGYICAACAALFCIGISSRTVWADAFWSGYGETDAWSDRGNWIDFRLPTSTDAVLLATNINFEPPAFVGHQSVSIDSVARAADWSFMHYGNDDYPFEHIRLLPGADFHIGSEYIDQMEGSYIQSDGLHIVDTDFRYYTYRGEFRMEGGTFIAGTIHAAPDLGTFSLMGGTVQARRIHVGTDSMGWDTRGFAVGGTANVHLSEAFAYIESHSEMTPMTFTRPLFMDGADFENQVREGLAQPDPFTTMHLVFRGGLGDVSRLEASSEARGNTAGGWIRNAVMSMIEVGSDHPAHVKLVDDVQNWLGFQPEPDNPVPLLPPDAVFVETLRITRGSVLDLNGVALYCRTLEDEGGTFLNGTPTVVPEPTSLWLLTASALWMFQRQRKRGRRLEAHHQGIFRVADKWEDADLATGVGVRRVVRVDRVLGLGTALQVQQGIPPEERLVGIVGGTNGSGVKTFESPTMTTGS